MTAPYIPPTIAQLEARVERFTLLLAASHTPGPREHYAAMLANAERILANARANAS